MVNKMDLVNDYIDFLKSKGFVFEEDAIGFINFGKQFTGASDELVKYAIEITLKAKISFDGSFYISLLEAMKEANISNKKAAYEFVEERKLFG